jgi:IS5 family transposase
VPAPVVCRTHEDIGYHGLHRRPAEGVTLTKRQRARNRRFGKVRAKVEHVFRVIKCQFGYRKVRYRGIAKNGAQVFALLALASLYLVRGRLATA